MAPYLETDVEPKEATSTAPLKNVVVPQPSLATAQTPRTPLKYSGSLDAFKHFDVTNVIGREYPEASLQDILKDDAKIRDLAITVSERGVVFFRNQDISVDEQKVLGQKLGELTGKPETSKLHRHALLNSNRGLSVDPEGKKDDEVSIIASEVRAAGV
jgi:alpha-ketoglutarate-dependent taurine dioxygenase